MSSIWQSQFWKDSIERAAKTAAQVLVTMLTAAQTNLLDVEWTSGFAAAGIAAALSLVTSVASVGKGSAGTASLVTVCAPTDDRHPDRAGRERDEVPAS
jgi:hypothetical protein